MGRVERSIEIKAAPEKVWEMLALDRLPEWNTGYKGELKSVEYTSEVRSPQDKLRVGASARGIPKKQGEPIKYNFEITESLENQKITYRLYGRYHGLVTHILEPVGEGTKATFAVHYEMPWGIPGKILEKLLLYSGSLEGFMIPKKDLQSFKSILEK